MIYQTTVDQNALIKAMKFVQGEYGRSSSRTIPC